MCHSTRPLSLVLLAALALCLIVAGCGFGQAQGGSATGATSQEGQAEQGQELPADDPYATGVHHVRIEVEGFGTIEAALNANVAPVTVSNFCHLAEEGFYDGLTFHRVVPGFVIQGGDPAGDGTGGSDETITGEFASNGIENNIPHVRGTLSMARSQDPNSASSQFFIVVADARDSLDGNYAAFGSVTSGMDVVDAICEHTPVADESSGYVAPEDQPVISSIEVLD